MRTHTLRNLLPSLGVVSLCLALAPMALAATDNPDTIDNSRGVVDFDGAAREAVTYDDAEDFRAVSSRIEGHDGEVTSDLLPTTLVGRGLRVGPRTNPWSVADYIRREQVLAGHEPMSHEEIAAIVRQRNMDVPGVSRGIYIDDTVLAIPPMSAFVPGASDGFNDAHESWQDDLVPAPPPPAELASPAPGVTAELPPAPMPTEQEAVGPFGIPGSSLPDRIVPKVPAIPTQPVTRPVATLAETAAGTAEAKTLGRHARDIAVGTGRAGLQAGRTVLETPVRGANAIVGAQGEMINGTLGAGGELATGGLRAGKELGEGYREAWNGLQEERSLGGHVVGTAGAIVGGQVRAAKEAGGGLVRAGQRYAQGVGSAVATGWNRLLGRGD